MTVGKSLLLILLAFYPFSLRAEGRPAAMMNYNDTIRVPKDGKAFLEQLLLQNPGRFADVIRNPGAFKLQVIYTRIDRDQYNKPQFRDFTFNLGEPDYFYPASTVKMPVALLALQRLNELKIKGLDKFSTMITGAGYSGQTPVFNDPTTHNGQPNIAHYIKKIFLVSDNDAYNRLYEFLGPGYINNELHKKGYKEAQIIHRLSIPLTEDENRHTNPVSFYGMKGNELYKTPLRFYTERFANRNDKIGTGYMRGDSLVKGPLDFSTKNRIALTSLHEILRSVMFPESMPTEKRFNLTNEDYRFVRQYMSQLPGETDFPTYDTAVYYDTYCKFLLFGSEKAARIPQPVKMYNKVGDAYGFLLDVAYIRDSKTGVEFMLSAVMYCNKDGILNDDKYDYDELGFPFFKYLGELIYSYEKSRKRKYKPVFSQP
jgi:beta-lactamase class A